MITKKKSDSSDWNHTTFSFDKPLATSSSNESDKLTDTQQKIVDTLDSMKDLLLDKNKKYGNSALEPVGVFTKHIKTVPENQASICVRLDDKLGRIRNSDVLRANDVSDIMGYCTLLLIAMGVSKDDIAKFKD